MPAILHPHLVLGGGLAAAVLLTACGNGAGSTTTEPTPTPTDSSSAPPTAPVTAGAVGSAVPLPTGSTAGFGAQTQIAMAGPGAPVVAYVHQDPSGDEDTTPNEDQLLTTVYDPATKTWSTPVKQATGDFEGRFGTDISLAADPTSGEIALAYGVEDADDNGNGVDLVLSEDGGKTWATSHVSKDPGAGRPAVALGGGKIYVGFPADDKGVVVATSAGRGTPAFTETPLPGDGPDYPPTTEQPALAVAPDGTLVAAYHTTTGDDYNRELLAWSPGDTKPVVVLDSAKYQNDDSTVGLTFEGDTAIAISSVLRSGGDTNIGYLSTSPDDGKTWSKAVGVPPGQDVSGPDSFAIAAGSAETVLAYYPNGGGSRSCSGVVIAGTTDLSTWRACDPFDGTQTDVTEQDYPDAVADTDGSIWVVFANTNTDGATPAVPTGILVWHDGGKAIAGDQSPPAS